MHYFYICTVGNSRALRPGPGNEFYSKSRENTEKRTDFKNKLSLFLSFFFCQAEFKGACFEKGVIEHI